MTMLARAGARAWRSITNIRQTHEDREPEKTRVFYNPVTPSGTVITQDTVLQVDAVWACIRYLSQTVGGLPWDIYKPLKGGGEIAKTHRAQTMISKRCSDEYSSTQFREVMMGWALRYGNGYAELERDVMGRVIAMHPLHPTRVQVKRDRVTGKLYYQVDASGYGFYDTPAPTPTATGGVGVRLEPKDIFHLRGFGEGPVGLDVTVYLGGIFGHARALQIFGSSFFGSGATPSAVISTAKPLTQDALDELSSRFMRKNTGQKNLRKPIFLDNDMKYQQMSVNPDEGQFIESSQYVIERICGVYGVPPHKIQHLLRATFSNIEHQSIEVVQDAISPWVKRFQDEFDWKVLGYNSREGYYSYMDLSMILRGDNASRANYYKTMREMGVFSADDIRALENLPTLGGASEKRVMQGQYTTLEKIGVDAPKPAPAPAQEPPATVSDVTNLSERLNAFLKIYAATNERLDAANERANHADDNAAENAARVLDLETVTGNLTASMTVITDSLLKINESVDLLSQSVVDIKTNTAYKPKNARKPKLRAVEPVELAA